MSLPVVLREVARTEYDEAFDYYDAKTSDLGVDFARRVQEVFDRIGSTPELHAVGFADVRKAQVLRFPYRVYYRAEAVRVEVIAIVHNARDPAIWKGRV